MMFDLYLDLLIFLSDNEVLNLEKINTLSPYFSQLSVQVSIKTNYVFIIFGVITPGVILQSTSALCKFPCFSF